MTDTSMPAAKPSLGVSTILSESFSIYFRNFVPMSLVCLVPIVLSYLVSFALLGTPDPLEVAGDPDNPFAYYTENGVPFLISMVFSIAVWGFIAAAMTSMAYDAKVGKPVSVPQGFRAGLSNLVMVALVVVVVYIVFCVGLALLIVPGLWIMGLWFVIVPAIVVEKAGFGALGRSGQLTKGYRWSLVGLALLFLLLAIVIGAVIGGVSTLLAFTGLSGGAGALNPLMIAAMLINGLLSMVLYAISGALAALAYARLVEIKEGRGISALADVFS